MIGKEIVVTEKLDGENTSLYSDILHARSMDSRHHPSRDWVKQLHGQIKHNIPHGWRIVGENVYAKHSIFYEDLESYFYAFAVFDENNMLLSWDDCLSVFDMLSLVHVPVIYRGPFDLEILQEIADMQDPERVEGFVARVTHSFHHDQYLTHAAKYVRPKHVQTDQHWMTSEIIPNQLIRPSRPVTGFFNTLTDEQKAKALAYTGDDHHGEREPNLGNSNALCNF